MKIWQYSTFFENFRKPTHFIRSGLYFYLFNNYNTITNYILILYELSIFDQVLGVMSQTRVSGENSTHDPHVNSLAHYPLYYQSTPYIFIFRFSITHGVEVYCSTTIWSIYPTVEDIFWYYHWNLNVRKFLYLQRNYKKSGEAFGVNRIRSISHLETLSWKVLKKSFKCLTHIFNILEFFARLIY